MEEILRKIYYEDSTDFFNSIYESSENNGRILTEEFKEKLRKFTKAKNESRKVLDAKIKYACNDNEKLHLELQKTLNKYVLALENENTFYIKRYYKQRR